jgi:hypothetical protein
MKLSDDWESFKTNLDRIHPRFDETIPFDFEHDEAESGL